MDEEVVLGAKDRRLLAAIIISMFATAWVFLKEPVEIYAGYVVVLLLLPVFVGRFGIPRPFSPVFSHSPVSSTFLSAMTPSISS
jgi:hypothetical protein